MPSKRFYHKFTSFAINVYSFFTLAVHDDQERGGEVRESAVLGRRGGSFRKFSFQPKTFLRIKSTGRGTKYMHGIHNFPSN